MTKLILHLGCLILFRSMSEGYLYLYHSHYPLANDDHDCFYEFEHGPHDLARHLVFYCIRHGSVDDHMQRHCLGTEFTFSVLRSKSVLSSDLYRMDEHNSTTCHTSFNCTTHTLILFVYTSIRCMRRASAWSQLLLMRQWWAYSHSGVEQCRMLQFSTCFHGLKAAFRPYYNLRSNSNTCHRLMICLLTIPCLFEHYPDRFVFPPRSFEVAFVRLHSIWNRRGSGISCSEDNAAACCHRLSFRSLCSSKVTSNVVPVRVSP